MAAQNLRSAAATMKSRYDRKAMVTPFEEGDKVWFLNPQRSIGRCPKLQRPWESGWRIVKLINDITVRIQTQGRKPRVVHIDRIARDERGVARRPRRRQNPLTAPCFTIAAESEN